MKIARKFLVICLLGLFVSSCAVLQEFQEPDADHSQPTDSRSSETPVRPLPGGEVRVEDVGAVSDFVVVLDSDGRAWRFGATDRSLGGPPWAGAVEDTSPIRAFESRDWISVGVGSNHLLLVSRDGELYTWGNNTGSVLGLGEAFSLSRFSVDVNRIAASEAWGRAFAGEQSSFAVTRDGRVFAWGNPSSGRLGLGPVTPDNPAMTRFEYWGPADSVEELGVPNPEPITGLSDIVNLAIGPSFVLALDANGRVFAWGDNADGVLGTGDRESRSTPVGIDFTTRVSDIAAGAYTSFAITDSGQLYGWGGNRYGELADSPNPMEVSPVTLFADRRWRDVATGLHSNIGGSTTPIVYAISDMGWLYYWASGERQPTALANDIGGWVSVTVSERRIIAIRRNGALYTWVHGEPVPPSRFVLR